MLHNDNKKVATSVGIARKLITGMVIAFAVSAPAQAAEPWFPIRTHNPFLQIFGLPAYSGAALVPAGTSAIDVSFDLANHADAASTEREEVILDGETYSFNFAYRTRFGERLELGVDVPLVAHSDGVLDELIEGWHDLWGMTNSKRTGPPNQLRLLFDNPAAPLVDITSGVSGLGDIRLGAAMPLGRTDLPRRITLRASLKLPTGDAEDLLGSGAADYSLGVYGDFPQAFGFEPLSISAHGGVLALGDSDLFSGIQESTVPFGGLAADWRLGGSWRAMAVMYFQGAYLDSELEEVGGTTLQLAVGGTYRLGADGPVIGFGIIEDMVSDATVDFALHMSVRYGLGQGT